LPMQKKISEKQSSIGWTSLSVWFSMTVVCW
jgi:hypothetical protein